MTFEMLICPLFQILKYVLLERMNITLNFPVKLMYESCFVSTHLYEIINIYSSIIDKYL